MFDHFKSLLTLSDAWRRLRPIAHLASIKALWTLVWVLAQAKLHFYFWCFFGLEFSLFINFQLDYFRVGDIHTPFCHLVVTSPIHDRHQVGQLGPRRHTLSFRALLPAHKFWTVLNIITAHILVNDQSLTIISWIILHRNAFLEVGSFLAGLDYCLPSDDRRWEQAAFTDLDIIDNSWCVHVVLDSSAPHQ